jgi:hypothetical protein
VVILSISRSNPPTQSSEGAHRGRVCVCVHRAQCMAVYVSVCVCTLFIEKKMWLLVEVSWQLAAVKLSISVNHVIMIFQACSAIHASRHKYKYIYPATNRRV